MLLEVLLLLTCMSASVMSIESMASLAELSTFFGGGLNPDSAKLERIGTAGLNETALEYLKRHKEANTCKVKLEADCPPRKGKKGRCFNDVHANCCYLINRMTLLEDGSLANSTKVNAFCTTNRNWTRGEIDCEDVVRDRVANYTQCNSSSLHGLLTEADQTGIEITYLCEDKKKMRVLKPNPKTTENKCAPTFYRKMSNQGCCSLKQVADGSVGIVCTANCQQET